MNLVPWCGRPWVRAGSGQRLGPCWNVGGAAGPAHRSAPTRGRSWGFGV